MPQSSVSEVDLKAWEILVDSGVHHYEAGRMLNVGKSVVYRWVVQTGRQYMFARDGYGVDRSNGRKRRVDDRRLSKSQLVDKKLAAIDDLLSGKSSAGFPEFLSLYAKAD